MKFTQNSQDYSEVLERFIPMLVLGMELRLPDWH